MNRVRVWLLILLSLFAVGLIPRASCQETNMVDIRAIINIDNIDFKEGKLTLYGLYLNVDVNESFGVYLFAPSISESNYWDEWTHYEYGWYHLSRQYFPNGIEVKFNLKETIPKETIFWNEVLECGIVIGLNVTAHTDTRDIYADLSSPLKDEWDINGTIVKVSKEEAALFTVGGMSAINSSIQTENIRELYLLRIQINRKPNIKKGLNWLPPIAMLFLLLFSILVIWKDTLANSLRIHLAVAFPSIAYFSFLREITPPVITSIEWLTLLDVGLSFIFAILAVSVHFIRSMKKEDLEEIPEGKKKPKKSKGNETDRLRKRDEDKNMMNEDIKNYIDKKLTVGKLDAALLFLCSSLSFLFGLVQTYFSGTETIPYFIPLVVLGWVLPFYIGYIRGAILNNCASERLMGWIYLIFGTTLYVSNLLCSFIQKAFPEWIILKILVSFIPMIAGLLSGRWLFRFSRKIFEICGKKISDVELEIADYIGLSAVYFSIAGFFYVTDYRKIVSGDIIAICFVLGLIFSGFLMYRGGFSYLKKNGRPFTILEKKGRPRIALFGKSLNIFSVIYLIIIINIPIDIHSSQNVWMLLSGATLLIVSMIIYGVFSPKRKIVFKRIKKPQDK